MKNLKELKIGDRFGELVVVSDIPERKITESHITGKKTFRALWKCECSCGNIVYRLGHKLRSGEINSCSDCAYRNRPQSTERYSNEERLYYLSIIRRVNATNGRIKNLLSIEDFIELTLQNCFYCGIEPRELTYLNNNRIVKRGSIRANGIDRIDSDGDYIRDNCVPCCKRCNVAKSTMNTEEFLNMVKRIYEKHLIRGDLSQE